MFTKKISQILTDSSPIIEASIYIPENTTKEAIIYLHGGGLVFGQRDDLPLAYIEAFTNAGHPVITLDYLLAPEVKLPTILATLKQTLEKTIEILSSWGFSSDYALMGRSAGSYLAALLIKEGFTPKHLISFYGYYTLDVPAFRQPNPQYLVFPRVAPMEVEALIEQKPIVSGEMFKRYPIYLSGRQFGNWLPKILPSLRDVATFSLNEDTLKSFPPTIFVHSTQDSDVPYELSRMASTLVPTNQLISIEGNEHDFDRHATPETLNVYQAVITFLEEA